MFCNQQLGIEDKTESFILTIIVKNNIAIIDKHKNILVIAC